MESEGRKLLPSLGKSQTLFDTVGSRTETPSQAGSGEVLVPSWDIDPPAISALAIAAFLRFFVGWELID